jgi:hemerythrin-like domain-containing protein
LTRVRNVKEYLEELEKGKEDRPDQVREGLEIYVELWRKVVEKGIVSETETVEDALRRIDEEGGLYKAAEE